jgi:hypothetical protein
MTTNADDPTPAANHTTPLETAPTEASPTTQASPTAQAAAFTFASSPPTAAAERPHVRWAGIVWGTLLVVFATATLVTVSSPARLAAVMAWIASLTPGAAFALWIALLGLVIVVSAVLGAIGAAQRRRRRTLF